MTKNTKQKIAILGSGMGSMVTAFELTNQPGWEELYDITVYQFGWRLGGKGACGRNMKVHQGYTEPDYRIEEHGFHIFFGFYENAFQVMKECYDALEGEPNFFQGVENAFSPHNFIVFSDYFGKSWKPWYLPFPHIEGEYPWQRNNQEVGSLWDYIEKTLELIFQKHHEISALDSFSQNSRDVESDAELANSNVLERFAHRLETSFDSETLLKKSDRELLDIADQFAKSIAADVKQVSKEDSGALLWILKRFIKQTNKKLEQAIAHLENDLDWVLVDAVRLLTIVNLFSAIVIGILRNWIEGHSFDNLDNYNFRTWLSDNFASTATINSPPVQVMYDLLFAFPGGVANLETGQLGVAATLRWIWRMIFTYKGAIMWRMNAGMGDTIFAPLYTVLKNRGVKFEFFHRVTNLGLNQDKTAISTIGMARQVTLKDPEAGYDPLMVLKDLHCWPDQPFYDQIIDSQAEQLQKQNINLESFWTPWQDVETFTLEQGVDFDLVVLGISIASFPFICPELIAAKSEWQEMVDRVQTITTQGGQFWLEPTLAGLGWTKPSPVLGTYVEPLSTYADMTHLLSKENWPASDSPQNLAYFTGVMEDPGIPDASHHDFPAEQQAKINNEAIAWFNGNTSPLWPDATATGTSGLDWNLVVDLDNGQGEQQRFDSQYWRINISPTERYVLSIPESQNYRLRADGSRELGDIPRTLDNLYLTGDWVDNEFNSGCIEATTMVGMATAQVLLAQQFGQKDSSRTIIGNQDAWPKPQSLNVTLGTD
jgi:uncharacterized protein with NAD-binding domain and iron-sulfur cluster